MNTQLTNLETIRTTIATSGMEENIKMIQLTQNGIAKGALSAAKKTLEDKLEKLTTFNSTSATIFDSISELENLVTKGASQANESWTGTGFSIPTDLKWTETVATKWKARYEEIKKKEKEFHEAKINELKQYTVYAWPYEDPTTKEVKVMWFIDKDGVRVFDEELQNYLEKYGKELDGIYEIVGWDKVYELDLAARRRGDGKNYLNQNELPEGGWQVYSAVGAYVETGYWYGKKTGLLDLAVAAGLSAHASKGPTSAPKKDSGSAFGEMSPSDAKRYNQYWDDVSKGLDTNTRVKLNQWEYRPSADLYNKYKGVYDNPKYYEQTNGKIHWPENDGFVNKNLETYSPGKILDRYGEPDGSFLGNVGDPYPNRALAPHSENATYYSYEVIQEVEVTTGEIAPWFDQPGGGTQIVKYHSNGSMYTIQELIEEGFIVQIRK